MELPAAKPAVSLAVLPFENLSASSDYHYFANGLVEDLIVDLSHFSGLQIMSSYTSGRLGGGQQDLVEEARNLSINYLLTGSIRRASDNLRLNTQLLSTGTSSVLWANHFDTPLEAILEVQDTIVERVVSAIQAEVDHDLLAAARNKPLTSLAAYDCWLRGMERLRLGTLADDEEARKFFRRALSIDPHYSRAYAGLSLSHFNEWSCRLWELYNTSEENAYQYAIRAMQLDDSDHLVQMILGRVYLFRRQFDEAEHHLERSLALNSNDPDCLVQVAGCLCYLGRTSEGERLFDKAIFLNPYRNLWYYQYGSLATFIQRRYRTSIEMALKRQLTNVWVDLPGFIAAAYAHLGEQEKAEEYLRLFLEFFTTSITKGRPPGAAEVIAWVVTANPFKYREDADNLVTGLKLAGIERLAGKAAPSAAVPSTIVPPPEAVMKKIRASWQLSFAGREVTVPDLKGLHDIARLLDAPETEFHCTDLMGLAASMDDTHYRIDARARQEYQNHIHDLQEEIEEATVNHDIGRKAQLERELDEVLGQLTTSTGLGGRGRPLKSPVERARAAVTLRIRNAIKKIAAVHPALGKHLDHSIRTGIFCSYSPEKQQSWLVSSS
ncbi:MAG: hypothetical protein IH612_05480 [Desulfofustis sp.]|nr:hypothetical protein [Desulfofustis sp.]